MDLVKAAKAEAKMLIDHMGSWPAAARLYITMCTLLLVALLAWW